jgi:cardiolipin synthase
VRVELLLAGLSDVPLARAATRSLYRQLLAAGIQIREWSGSVLHAKVASVDGRRLLVGSFNLDPFSLANLEALVEVHDAAVVTHGEVWIQTRLARSRPVTSLDTDSRLRSWLLDPLGRLVVGLVVMIARTIASRARRQTSKAHSSNFSKRPRAP